MPNAEQKEKLDAILKTPETIQKAFSFYSEAQGDIVRAKLRVWQIESVVWTLIHVLLVCATAYSLWGPGLVAYQWPLALCATLVALVRLFINYSVPRL